MPKLEQWANFPKKLRRHLIQRMADRSITIGDLNQLRLSVEFHPEVPDGEWYKDFGYFKVCREGPYPKHFSCPASQHDLERRQKDYFRAEDLPQR